MYTKYFIIGLIGWALASCDKKDPSATATIEAKNNSGISGTVEFCEKGGNVYLEAEIEGLTEGIHAIHIHENGDCSSSDGKSAGGHWNPTGANHGKWGSSQFQLGDIGNIKVGKDGKGNLKFKTDMWCLTCEDDSKSIIGKSIVIHAGEDDFTSQPAGAAGDRIGCGAIMLQDDFEK